MNNFIYLFSIAGIVIGIARAVCEGANWNWKDGVENRSYVNSAGKYHLFSILQFIGVFVLAYTCILYGKSGTDVFLTFILFPVIIFFSYYYPYSKVFNHTRYRKWYSGNYYLVYLFGKELKIKYIPEKIGVIAFVASLFIGILFSFW